MPSIEEQLKRLILTKYKSIRKFANEIDIPYTTMDSILKRGVRNANIVNILKITKALNIDTEQLALGKISLNAELDGSVADKDISYIKTEESLSSTLTNILGREPTDKDLKRFLELTKIFFNISD